MCARGGRAWWVWLMPLLVRAQEPAASEVASPERSSRAQALTPQLPMEMQAPFTLFLNHVEKGGIVVLLKDGDVFVRREDLIEVGLKPLGGDDVSAAGKMWLSLRSVSPPLQYTLDEENIELRIIAPPEYLPHVTMDFGVERPDMTYGTGPSAFFNYAPRVTDTGLFTMYQETGASLGGALLFSSAYLSSTRDPLRGMTNLTLDHRPTLLRTTIGDTFALTGALGSGVFLGGASIARSYDIDPYVARQPSHGFVGSTLTPATVDIYVNGTRVRSEDVQPGVFELSRLRLGNGSGEVTYVVRDIFGKEQRMQTPFYVSSTALAAGVDELSYAVGAVRRGIGQRDADYEEAAFLGQHRFGASDHVTLGVRAEATVERLSTGPALTLLTDVGQFDLEAGASQASGEAGIAGSLAYSYVSRIFSGGVFGRVTSHRYATVSLAPEHDRATADVGAFQAIPLGQRLSFSLQGALAKHRDTGTEARISAQWSVNPASGVNVILSATEARNEFGTWRWGVFATLSWVLPGDHSFAATGNQEQRTDPSLQVNLSKSVPQEGGFGYRAQTVLAEQDSVQLAGQYQVPIGRYQLQYDGTESMRRATFDAAGAIVIVPGAGVFATLPVQQGFGVIRLPGVAGVRGYVNNHEVGRTDRHGNLLAPHMLSYYGNRLRIEPLDVPMQYELRETELTLAPPNRGAIVAEFPVTIPHFYRGTLRVLEGQAPVIPEYGQVRIEVASEDEVVSPLGKKGEFELSGVPSGAHTAWVDYAGGTCQFTLTLPESRDTVVAVGEVTCTMH
jgi:outer membrane usher protein